MASGDGRGAFRGVPFLVWREQRERGGRNIVRREYPLRETGGADDLGPKLAEFTFSVLVMGDDVQTQRNRLRDALRAPGAGELLHPGSQWRNRTLEHIASDLCAPFGVTVRWQVNDATAARPFSTFTLENSETVADALTRAARHRGVLVTSNAAGELVFTQAGSQRGDTLTLGENLLDLDHNVDHRLRHSEYRVRGHGRGGGHAGDALTAGTLAAPVGTVTDSAIHRYRPKIVLADHAVDADGARQRAVREMRRAVARSVRLTATVRHWFRENGQLWDINLLTAVTAPRTGVEERDLLVCQVEFSLDANHGETTRLILAPRDGFIVPAEPGNSGSGNAGDVDAFVRAQMKKQGIKFNDE